MKKQQLVRDLAGKTHFMGHHDHGPTFFCKPLDDFLHFSHTSGSSADVGESGCRNYPPPPHILRHT